jgi:tetratricopeptide (TPR) repeat protein
MLHPRMKGAAENGRTSDEHAVVSGWLEQPVRRTALLVHGPLGSGRTVLTRWAATHAKSHGWTVVMGSHRNDGGRVGARDDHWIDYLLRGSVKVFLVVDDADHWPLGDLLAVLLRCAGRTDRVRCLLTCRTHGFWMHVAAALRGAEFRVGEPLALPARTSAASVDDVRRLVIADLAAGDRLNPEGFLTRKDLVGAIAVLSLLRGVITAEAENVLGRMGVAAPQRVVESLRRMYPASTCGDVIAAPYAYALTGSVLSLLLSGGLAESDDPVDGVTAGWPNFVERLVGVCLDVDNVTGVSGLAEAVLTTLAAVAPGRPDLGPPTVGAVLAASQVLGALAEETVAQLCDVAGIDVALPVMNAALDVVLDRADLPGAMRAAVLVSERLVDSCRTRGDMPGLAGALSSLGIRYGLIGRYEKGLGCSREAVATARSALNAATEALARRSLGIDTVEPRWSLLMALNNHANIVAATDRDAAIAANAEAADLAETIGGPADEMLAIQLGQLAQRLLHAGRAEEALTAATRAADICRPDGDGGVHRLQDFVSNRVLGCKALIALSRFEEAVDLAEGSLVLIEQLDDYVAGDLLMALSHALMLLGSPERALGPARRAVEYWHLEDLQNSSTRSQLLVALMTTSQCLAYLDRRDEAVAVALEAVMLSTPLVADAAEGRSMLPVELADHLGSLLSEVGEVDRALGATSLAAALARSAAERRPNDADVLSAGGRTLTNLSLRLSRCGERAEALAAAREGVAALERLVIVEPGHEATLAFAKVTLASCMANVGKLEEGLVIAHEAMTIYDQGSAGTEIWRRDAALSWWSLARLTLAAGRGPEAVELARRANELYESVPSAFAAAFSHERAQVLDVLVNAHVVSDEWEDAVEAATEAAATYRRLAEDHPAVYGPMLGITLANLGGCLANLQRLDEASLVLTEAVRRLRPLVTQRAMEGLAVALINLGSVLLARGSPNEARATATEAVELLRAQSASEPRFASQLDVGLALLAEIDEAERDFSD